MINSKIEVCSGKFKQENINSELGLSGASMWGRYSLNSLENLLEHWQSERGRDLSVQRPRGGRAQIVTGEEQGLKPGGREY